MSKSNSGLFLGTSGEKAGRNTLPVNGTDYNLAESSSIQRVEHIEETNNAHSIPQHGIPNSVLRNFKNGNLVTERYFDSNGDAYLDIDYTNHGNAKMHPDVPHEHRCYFDSNGKMHREDSPDGGIKK